jgi:hypothetical protein
MPAPVVSRPAESRAVADFLAGASRGPSGLMVEGEASIGKTTLLLAAVDDAVQRGFRVMSARSAAAESVLAHAGLADLVSDVDVTGWAELPDVQRLALDRVLLRADAGGPAMDQLEAAAGFLAVVRSLVDESPVLLAIDDLQWLDTSSRKVVAFAARRLSGRVGVLGSSRTDPAGGADTWLNLPRPDAMARITLSPWSLGRLHSVVSQRLGRSLPRSTMVRIHEISAGNPFYALELARAMDGEAPNIELRLPPRLADLVRARIGQLDTDVQDGLLAASCVATPTVELLAAATGTAAERIVESPTARSQRPSRHSSQRSVRYLSGNAMATTVLDVSGVSLSFGRLGRRLRDTVRTAGFPHSVAHGPTWRLNLHSCQTTSPA